MAQRTYDQLTAEISGQFPTNGIGQITALNVRTVLQDMLDSQGLGPINPILINVQSDYQPTGSIYRHNQNLTAGYVRGVDFIETSSINPLNYPNDLFISWDWIPTSTDVKSYPLVDVFAGTVQAWNAYTTITSTFDWSLDEGGGSSANVLHECWLASPTVEIEVFLRNYYGQNPRSIGVPFRTIAGGTHMQESFDVYSIFSGWKKLLVFPVNKTVTNFAQNPNLTGSVAGTPGTDPTSCQFKVITSTGITKSIIGSGSTVAPDGTTVNYVDVRFNGTPVGNGSLHLQFYQDGVTSTMMSANLPGNEFLLTGYLAVVGGSTTNIGATGINASSFSSGGGFLSSGGSGDMTPNLTGSLQKFGILYPNQYWDGFTFFIAPFFSSAITGGSPIDITFRVGSPYFAGNAAPPPANDIPSVSRTIRQDRFDWLQLLNSLKLAGLITGAELLGNIQIAPEIITGHGSFHLRRYSVEIA